MAVSQRHLDYVHDSYVKLLLNVESTGIRVIRCRHSLAFRVPMNLGQEAARP